MGGQQLLIRSSIMFISDYEANHGYRFYCTNYSNTAKYLNKICDRSDTILSHIAIL
jgi:hypothetical protein